MVPGKVRAGWTQAATGHAPLAITPPGKPTDVLEREGQEQQMQLMLETRGLGLGVDTGGSQMSPSPSPLTRFLNMCFPPFIKPSAGP